METTEQIADEFAVPEIRERLRRAYGRLAAERQKRAHTPAAAAALSVGDEDEIASANHQQTYVQQRMF